jgi:16S rRNA G1207 methylase RsmC
VRPEDVYFKKTLTYNFWKQSLVFRTSQELFSSHDVDLGTQFLLRSIVEADYPAPQSILDLGCGYGPLGLTLKKIHPGSGLHMADRDALAVEYASQNAELNGAEGIQVYGSLGYDDIHKTDFNLIVCNIPGKAGEGVITGLLREAGDHLAAGGITAVVVVSALDEMVSRVLENTPGLEVILKRSRSGHSVFHYRFNGIVINKEKSAGALERGIYLRNSQVFHFSGMDYAMQTAYGLPEFDSLDYRSELLMKTLAERPPADLQAVAVYNPGQGHTAVMLWNRHHPQSLALADRDLLALRYAKLNLSLNHCPADKISVFHQVGMSAAAAEKYNLIAAVLREEEGEEAMEQTLRQAAACLSTQGMLLVAAGSTAITRLSAFLHRQALLRIQSREKWKGNSLLVLSGNTANF